MDDNGLFINNSIFIPREILTHILSFVHPYTLVSSCKLVCRNWNEIIENDLWRSVIIRSSNINSAEQTQLKYPYPFGTGRNLLRNNCAQNGLEYWSVKLPRERLNESCGWWIENVPLGTDPLPLCRDFGGHSSCFTSSYQLCEKEQEIDLRQNGISEYLMDVWQPKIIVSEWFAARFDCGCIYSLTVLLLDEKKALLHHQNANREVKRKKLRKWQKIVLKFENYGPGVRFIVFNHQGKDTRFWLGQYGSKMSGGVVKLSLSKPSGD